MKKDPNLLKKEKDLLQAFGKGEFVSVDNLDKRRKEVAQAARRTLSKNKRINIRMQEQDLLVIKKKANQHGLPYQTLISTLIHHYAKGKITLML